MCNITWTLTLVALRYVERDPAGRVAGLMDDLGAE